MDRWATSPCQILLQNRVVQDSSTLPELAGPHGSHIKVGGVCPPSHVSHLVVSEATLEPPVTIQDPSKQGSQPDASVVVGQRMAFSLPNTTITITTDVSMEGWGGHCQLPGSTTPLYNSLWSKSERRLHINVLKLRAVRLTLLHLEQEIFGQLVLIKSNNMATVLYINKPGGVVSQDHQRQGLLSVRVGDPQINQTPGDSPTRRQQRVGRLSVAQSPRPYRVAPQSADSTVSVSDMWQAPSGSLRLSPKPSAPTLVLSNQSATGGGLQRPVSAMDRAVPLRLSSHPSSREDFDQYQGGSGGGHHHRPSFAEEILVPPSPDHMACEISLLLPRR